MPKSHFSEQLHHKDMWAEKKISRKTFESQNRNCTKLISDNW